jgi:hypothetical protein
MFLMWTRSSSGLTWRDATIVANLASAICLSHAMNRLAHLALER